MNLEFSIGADMTVHVLMRGWHGPVFRDGHSLLLGTPIVDGKILDEGAKREFVRRRVDEPAATTLKYFSRLNGFFGCVIVTPDGLRIVSDRVRSRPVFFASRAKSVWVSDDAFWVRDSAHLEDGDTLSQECFVRSLYTPGPRTFIRGLSQVEAGQMVTINDRLEVTRDFYSLPNPSGRPDESSGESALADDLLGALLAATERACAYAGGRQLVVPLSGGLDSRAIVAALAQLRYDRVLCVTYGAWFSSERSVAGLVAAALGMPWIDVQYTWRRWQKTQRVTDFAEYQARAFSLISCPNLQAFPAMLEIHQRQQISPDAVFLPGHTGDFLAGKQVDKELFRHQPSHPTVECLEELILRRHFGHNRDQSLSVEASSYLRGVLQNLLEWSSATYPTDPLLAATQTWNQRERQAKFICNSNRYYDFFGYDWWMPLWDAEFASQWEKVPLQYRKRGTLWETVVSRLMAGSAHTALCERIIEQDKMAVRRNVARRLTTFLDPNLTTAIVPLHATISRALRLAQHDYAPLSFAAAQTQARYAQ